jgi:hypothetical protein
MVDLPTAPQSNAIHVVRCMNVYPLQLVIAKCNFNTLNIKLNLVTIRFDLKCVVRLCFSTIMFALTR